MAQLLSLKHNVHEVCGRAVVRVQADIDKEIFDYFFHHVLGYSHGSRQALITFFFQSLYEEFQRQGIQKVWNEENETNGKLLEIINRLNFNESKPKKHESRRVRKSTV